MTPKHHHLLYIIATSGAIVYLISTLARSNQRRFALKSSPAMDDVKTHRVMRLFDSYVYKNLGLHIGMSEKTHKSALRLKFIDHFNSSKISSSDIFNSRFSESIAHRPKAKHMPNLPKQSFSASSSNNAIGTTDLNNVLNRKQTFTVQTSDSNPLSNSVHQSNNLNSGNSVIASQNTDHSGNQGTDIYTRKDLSRDIMQQQHQDALDQHHTSLDEMIPPRMRMNANNNINPSSKQVPTKLVNTFVENVGVQDINDQSRQPGNEKPLTRVASTNIHSQGDGNNPDGTSDLKPLVIVPNTSARIYVVTTFTLYSAKIKQAGPDVRQRIEEYLHCLKGFTTNQHVREVHLLYDEPEMVEFVHRRVGVNPKLYLHKVQIMDKALTTHQFAFNHLHDKLVFVTHADILMDKGFELVDESVIRNRKLMYALSRHEVTTECHGTDFCERYMGSHDGYIFVPQGTLTPKAIDLLNHRLYDWGTENRIMYVYSEVLGYRVLNPCKVIYIYHRHCSKFRYDMKSRAQVQNYRLLRKPTLSLA